MFALQPEMKVFSGSANRELAQRICNYIGVPLGHRRKMLAATRSMVIASKHRPNLLGQRRSPKKLLSAAKSP